MTITQVAQLSSATLIRLSDQAVTHYALDSRLCQKGSLFFALKGTHSNGLHFIQDAEKRGAVGVVVHSDDVPYALSATTGAILASDDVSQTLMHLASSYRNQFPHVRTIGITGSTGKSTTKEAIGKIASTLGSTTMTSGNLNSEYGLALSILTLGEESKYGVFEVGIDHPGEMERMASMLKPSIALLTNIGNAHLESMGSREIIAREKAKIFHPTVERGFISRHTPYRSFIQSLTPVELQRYGIRDISAIDLGLHGWQLTYRGVSFRIKAVGKHLLEDVVGAIAVGSYLGARPVDIAHGLEDFEPLTGRATVQSSEVTIINDTYNASLDSTRSIIRYLSALSWRGRKKAVLGPMKELGSESKSAHLQIAKALIQSTFTKNFLYGRELEEAYYTIKREKGKEHVSFTQDFEELEVMVKGEVTPGDLVLLKGSRAVAMERLIPTIETTVAAHG
ncbi:MAG: UDP-N-acetylmuramoyl-tripeptide--D-alanyl-D-alanine ligase [Sphaerochaeta sp.]